MQKQSKEDLYLSVGTSVGFKRRIVERLRLGIPEVEICEQYGISKKLLREWNRWYERHFYRLYKPPTSMKSLPPNTHPEELIQELTDRLRVAEQSRRDAELRAAAWKIVISIASEDLGLDIEKKFGSGQLLH